MKLQQLNHICNILSDLKNASLSASQGREVTTLKSEIAELQTDNTTLVDNVGLFLLQLLYIRT